MVGIQKVIDADLLGFLPMPIDALLYFLFLTTSELIL
jgi:hypothetical protein